MLLSFASLGQTQKSGTIKIRKVDSLIQSKDTTVFTIVDQQPEYPGGNQAMYAFLNSTIIYPDSAKNNGITGTVYITFVINPDGKLSEATIARGIRNCPECDREAMRVILLMPDWIPGKQSGRAVRVKYMLPIKFNLK